MAKGANAVGMTALGDCEAEGVAVAVDVEAVEGLVVAGGVAFAPEAVAGAGVVDSAAALEGGNDGFLDGEVRVCV